MNKKVNITTGTGSDASAINATLSRYIKQYRRQKRLSLDELSRLTGVSKGMLVDIEACRANPSIGLLCRLASAIGVSVADVVNIANKPSIHLIVAEDIPQLWSGEHGGSAKLVAGTSGPDMIELWQWTIYPEEIFNAEPHSQGTNELLHVTQGSLLLTIGEDKVVIKQGCSAIARTDVPHSYASSENSPVEFTMTVFEQAR